MNKTEMNNFEPADYVKLTHPEWSKNAVIYQINTRQFTPEGTFKAAQKELPRLKDLGIDIIWLMPIHPIGEKNRKGTLGSPYAVKDYYGVNPEFGNEQDLKNFINEAHQLGMKVILDWVANHTAWDNVLVETHPEWYQRDHNDNFRPTPWWDWDDIINLDYEKPGLREYMTEAMSYWVKEFDIDGYRCDVAGFVPVDFWNNVRKTLDSTKPVFMLAEWESRDLHAEAFDMTYAWSWNETVHQICKGKADLNKLFVYYSWNESAYPKNAIRMTHIANHDSNAWEGTMFENFGDGLEAAIALSVVGEGMPMVYNGMEAGNDKRLAFFEKDPIVWKVHEFNDLFKDLFALLKNNSALWHAKWGATMIKVPNNAPTEVLSFVRQNENNKVFAVLNFSDKVQNVQFEDNLFSGNYNQFGSGEQISFNTESQLTLQPWDYKIYTQ
ncbi:alpha-amlyase [Paucihalobacter ruber]|uniref:Alpha-amlyase n=2 Tax=Paucihalobacter ruber TaxID=2567861 RepID=A0A506PI62_9FLAO|nr:alpha-amlyase [Paucihalobacter ruber]